MKSSKSGGGSKGQKPVYLDANLQIVFGITIMAILGFVSVTPALPKIMQELKISAQDVGLLISVFTLPSVIFAIPFGILADRLGRKKIIITSLIIFGVAGTACAFARNFNLLLVLRFFQGIGAAPLMSLSVTIIGDNYSGLERNAAMGYNVSALYLSSAVLPALGGALAMLGWYYPFLLSIAAIPVGLIVMFSLNNPEPQRERQLRQYLKNAWKGIRSTRVVGLFFASSVTFLILFGSIQTYLPLLIAISFGGSPLVIGVIISILYLTAAITSSQVRKLTKFCWEGTMIKLAFILYAVSIVIIPLIGNVWLLTIPAIIFGFGHGINECNIHSLLVGCAPMKHRAAFLAVNWMILRAGATLGPLIMGLFFVTWGMASTFYAGATISAVMFAMAVALIR